jgi:hypothetical protein
MRERKRKTNNKNKLSKLNCSLKRTWYFPFEAKIFQKFSFEAIAEKLTSSKNNLHNLP